jgi:hypothetical protein
VLPPEPARPALSTRDIRLDGDEVASIQVASGHDDPAGYLVTEDDRRRRRKLTVHNVQIGTADADGERFEQDRTRSGHRLGKGLDTNVTRAVEPDRPHQAGDQSGSRPNAPSSRS